ncbi:hypothetical protein G5C60_44970 [Streptomyces sp. HC44]|uniref:Uncharacterized protein n=1 Tax=Streptomyces scabichelini TaxID=2711217 RepID=A0A6G4VLB5_9ACTN|nr:hypothetical protein [Streptomyces scabichelini]NGO14563.1 hypothetical protein [Streptomyces scabichelini]
MIELRAEPGSRAGRSGRIGLLLGLVLLVTAHLAGVVHGASFSGPHVSTVAAAWAAHGEHHEEKGDAVTPSPGHEHGADDHLDHAADRPRADLDDAVAELSHDGLPNRPGTADPAAGRAAGRPPWDVPDPPGGRSALSLHCVWRQ